VARSHRLLTLLLRTLANQLDLRIKGPGSSRQQRVEKESGSLDFLRSIFSPLDLPCEGTEVLLGSISLPLLESQRESIYLS